MLRKSLREYAEHYHLERSHQGIENYTIVPLTIPDRTCESVGSRRRLGGL